MKSHEFLAFRNDLRLPNCGKSSLVSALGAVVPLQIQLATFIKDLNAKVGLFSEIATRVHFHSNLANAKLWNIEFSQVVRILKLLFVEIATLSAIVSVENLVEFKRAWPCSDRNLG